VKLTLLHHAREGLRDAEAYYNRRAGVVLLVLRDGAARWPEAHRKEIKTTASRAKAVALKETNSFINGVRT
jgi:hypothetical protein